MTEWKKWGKSNQLITDRAYLISNGFDVKIGRWLGEKWGLADSCPFAQNDITYYAWIDDPPNN